MPKHVYFLFYKVQNGRGYGSCEVVVNEEITDIGQVRQIERDIVAHNDDIQGAVLAQNFQLLRVEA